MSATYNEIVAAYEDRNHTAYIREEGEARRVMLNALDQLADVPLCPHDDILVLRNVGGVHDDNELVWGRCQNPDCRQWVVATFWKTDRETDMRPMTATEIRTLDSDFIDYVTADDDGSDDIGRCEWCHSGEGAAVAFSPGGLYCPQCHSTLRNASEDVPNA